MESRDPLISPPLYSTAGAGMQNPATPAPAAAPSKGKSAAQNPSGHHAATTAPSGTPSKGKSAAAQAAAAGQGSSSHHHSAAGADASAPTLKRKRGVFQKDRT